MATASSQSHRKDPTMTTTQHTRAPRLRRLFGLVAAIAAVAVIVPGAASAKTVKVPSSISMEAQPSGNGVGTAFLFGNVFSEKKACQNRTVYIYRQVPGDPNSWDYGWAAFEITSDDPGFTRYLSKADEAYDYTAAVGKSVVKKPNKKIVCLSASMDTIVVPR